MPRSSVRRLCAALAAPVLVTVPVVLAAPAHASVPTCTSVGDDLTVHVAIIDSAVTVSRVGGNVVVSDDLSGGLTTQTCAIPSAAGPGGIQLDLTADDAHHWTISYQTPFTAADATSITKVVLHPQPFDMVVMDASGSSTPRTWKYQPGTVGDFDLDGNPATTELSLGYTGPIKVVTGSGDDVVDLEGYQNYSADFNLIQTGAGNDTVRGSDGEDQIESGDGNDTVYGDGGPDTIIDAPGDDTYVGGTQASHFDGFSDVFDLYPHDGADTVNPGSGTRPTSSGTTTAGCSTTCRSPSTGSRTTARPVRATTSARSAPC